MEVPTSTGGLSPTRRCQDLAQREMICKKRLWTPLRDMKVWNLMHKLHNDRYDAFASIGNGKGVISVFSMGGGYHKDCRSREYKIENGFVVSITRETR